MSLTYTIVGDGDESNIVVFVSGSSPLVAHSSHPNYDRIVDGAKDGDAGIVALFDLAATAAARFDRLSPRVTVQNGRVFFDGDEVDNALTEQVRRFIDAGVEDWRPLVAFFENVMTNPNEHSREMLFSWLNAEAFTITPDGLIVGYKGVRPGTDAEGFDVFYSIHSGRAIVDGVACEGNIPNQPGSVVEMPRGDVQHDPGVGCHTGLHVGTYAYASDFACGALLEVHVNPRDVVSVPTDCGAQKMRTCRYRVVRAIDAQYDSPVLYDQDGDEW